MECCVCEDKFTDLPLYVEHFARKHAGGDLSQGLRAVLSQEDGIAKFPEKDEALAGVQKSEIKETIHFSTDSSYLLLDERLLTGELDVITSNNSISNEGSASTFTLYDDKLPGSGRFVPWLFEGGSIEKTLALWTLSEDRKHEKIEAHDFFKKEFSDLEMLCTMRSKFLAADEGLMRISSALDQYIASMRVASTQYSQQFMSTHQEELEAAVAIVATLSALSNDIKGAGDSKKEIRKYEMHIALALHEIDAMIDRDLAAMLREGFKLGEASARAFRSIVAISLKSYIRTLLQDLVDKDATEKASAAEAPSLEDLSLDAKKSGVGLENYYSDCSLNAIIQSL